jgi:hypothetical protein
MRIAKKTGLVSEQELSEGEAEPVLFWHGGQRPAPRPPARSHGDTEPNGSADTPPVDDSSDGF